jgi:hypothetical protein
MALVLTNVATVLMNGTRVCMALGERDGGKEKAANQLGPINPQICITKVPTPLRKGEPLNRWKLLNIQW